MKTLKTILALTILTISMTNCTKQSLTDDDMQLNNSDIIYATGGLQDDSQDPD